jgi:hypothetical protein
MKIFVVRPDLGSQPSCACLFAPLFVSVASLWHWTRLFRCRLQHDKTPMTAAEFKKKWSRYQGKETSAYQGHFDDLCRLLGQPTPAEADPVACHESYEKSSTNHSCRHQTVDAAQKFLRITLCARLSFSLERAAWQSAWPAQDSITKL